MLVAIVLARALDDLVVGESTRRLADQALLVGELEVHDRDATGAGAAMGAAPAVRRSPCRQEAGGSDVGGETAGDDALLRSFGDEAVGLYSCCPYTLDLNTDSNKRFIAAMVKEFNVEPGFYAAGLYVNCMVVEEGLKKTGGKSDDKEAFMKALKSVTLADTPRGPIKFDNYGNVIGDFYVRHLEKAGGRLVNKTVKTYKSVSQFWTYDEKKFLAQPVYSRDFPPLKN